MELGNNCRINNQLVGKRTNKLTELQIIRGSERVASLKQRTTITTTISLMKNSAQDSSPVLLLTRATLLVCLSFSLPVHSTNCLVVVALSLQQQKKKVEIVNGGDEDGSHSQVASSEPSRRRRRRLLTATVTERRGSNHVRCKPGHLFNSFISVLGRCCFSWLHWPPVGCWTVADCMNTSGSSCSGTMSAESVASWQDTMTNI